jgi:hypothetical protein
MKRNAWIFILFFQAFAQAVETIDGPADRREWPLDPSDRPDRADSRNRIDPATVPAIAAFPGAEGHGALSIGGRGGRVTMSSIKDRFTWIPMFRLVADAVFWQTRP